MLQGPCNDMNRPALFCPSGNCIGIDVSTHGVYAGYEDIADEIQIQCPERTI